MEKTIGDKKIVIRPLTRGEVRNLRSQGINLANLDPVQADEAIDKVLGTVLGERLNDLDDLPNADVMGIFKDVMSLTYGGPDVKNS